MADVSIEGIANLSPQLQRAFQSAVKAEKRPLEAIEQRKAAAEERLGLLNDIIGKVGNVKALLPELGNPVAFRELAVESSDEGILSGSADKNIAEPGTYTFQVNQLAKGATALSNRFEDKDETRVGSGYFTFTTRDGESKEVFIDNENATLEGIAKIINTADVGMRASVINDQSDSEYPYRLILVGDGSGAAEDLEYPEFYFIDGEEDFFIAEERPAQNAKINYEGFEIESPSNQVNDLIPGVSLDLKGITGPGKYTSLTVEQDIPKTTVKMNELVGGLNEVFTFIQKQNDLNEDSNTFNTLGGDYGIRMADRRIKDALRSNFLFKDGKKVQTLIDIGVQFTRNGTLEFDEKKFQHALETNYHQVVDLLSGDGKNYGVIPKLNSALRSIAGRQDAVLSNQKKTYMNKVQGLNEEIETKGKRADERLKSLRDKLAKTESALARMRGQSAQMGQAGPDALLSSMGG